MRIQDHFIAALESLTVNKLRSGLTMLGIIIGVAAVISMLAIGNGAQLSITNSINSMGTNLLFITSGFRTVRNPKPLTLEDAQALVDAQLAPDVLAVAPILQGRETVTYGGQTDDTTVIGVNPDYASMRNLALTEGSFFTQDSLSSRSTVAVIGPDTATTLFGRTTNVVGETIRVNGQIYHVTGVLQSKGGSSLGSQDDQVLIPLTTAQSRLFTRGARDRVDTIYVQARSSDTVDAALQEVTQILQTRHRTPVGTSDFTITKMADILSAANSIIGVLTIFLGGIGGISLLVGGIGIMNIMLVSVSERTREIGLRKALGANKGDILLQFLMESSVLSLLGGAIGILAAWGISSLVGKIAAAYSTAINPVMGWNAILLATLFSAAIGVFFGIYPANRAANLEPVEALRTE